MEEEVRSGSRRGGAGGEGGEEKQKEQNECEEEEDRCHQQIIESKTHFVYSLAPRQFDTECSQVVPRISLGRENGSEDAQPFKAECRALPTDEVGR